MTSRRLALAALLILVAIPASAEQPGFRLGVVTWAEANYSGEANSIAGGGRIVADGPVANLHSRPLRVNVRLDLSSTPDAAFDLADLSTYGRTAEARVGFTYRLWRDDHDAGEQSVSTSLYAEGGFITALRDEPVRDRYHRLMELGAQFDVRMTKADHQAALLRIGYARDESAGYVGIGQIALAGEVPIGGKGLLFGGRALLNLSRASVSPQRDRFQVFVGLDVSRLYRVIAGD